MKFDRIKSEPIQWQLAPMIDVVFLLLCFFVTSSIYAQWETEMDVVLPAAESGGTPQRQLGEIIINVRSDGRLIVNSRELSGAQLGELLLQISELWKNPPVVIRGDQNARHGDIMSVMDLCRRAALFNITVATTFPE
jgi:biopolymer transport protein ExbD